MKKLLSIFLALFFITPLSLAKDDSVTIAVYDFTGNKIFEKIVSQKEAIKIEKDLLQGRFHELGIKFDFGIGNYIISYGKGKVYIPFSKERSFLRLMLRPIFFNYEKGITFVKFGANYFWKGKSIGDFGLMLRRQSGMMLGFIGLHVKISHKLKPDTHIFIGNCFFMATWDKIL